MKRIIVGLVAQNNAGKSEIAKGLAERGIKHYSVRDGIRKRHREIHGTEIENVGHAFRSFCQGQKKEHGYHVFIDSVIDDFMTNDNKKICVIESLRAPGEAQWFINEVSKKHPKATVLLIGITAPYEQRLGRFMKGRPDELGERTQESFDERERIVNNGSEPWEESVENTLRHAHEVFENPDGELQQTVDAVHEYLKRYEQ
jgi:dephospho-CoA kinase